MPITKDNFRRFYFGMAAELFIQGEIYAHGYEVHKMQPDIGFDIIAQNCALVHFCGATPRHFHIQVKSRILNNSDVVFCISESEFALLLSDESSALVCVVMYPRLGRTYNPFDYANFRESSLMIDNQICENLAREELRCDHGMRVGEIETKYNITTYAKKYLWLNHNHIKRLVEEGFFRDNQEKQRKELCVVFQEGTISLRDSDQNCFELAEEMHSIKYMLIQDVLCRDDLDLGKLFVLDAFGGVHL